MTAALPTARSSALGACEHLPLSPLGRWVPTHLPPDFKAAEASLSKVPFMPQGGSKEMGLGSGFHRSGD